MYYEENKIYYVVFPNTRTFLRALPLVEVEGIEHRVISIPDHLSTECGMALEIKGRFAVRVSELLQRNNITFEIRE